MVMFSNNNFQYINKNIQYRPIPILNHLFFRKYVWLYLGCKVEKWLSINNNLHILPDLDNHSHTIVKHTILKSNTEIGWTVYPNINVTVSFTFACIHYQTIFNTMCGYKVQDLEETTAQGRVYTTGCLDRIVWWGKRNLFLVGGLTGGLLLLEVRQSINFLQYFFIFVITYSLIMVTLYFMVCVK